MKPRNPATRSLAGIVVCAAALSFPGMVFAQEDAQRCEGTVTDDQGMPLQNVTISFMNLAKNVAAQPVKTSKKGRYSHNFLASVMDPGYEIRATLEGYKMVMISALTTRGDGTNVTNDTYMVGSDQKGLHKVLVPPQARSDVSAKGKCVVDFVLAPEDRFSEAFHKLQAETLAKEGKPPPPTEAAPLGSPGQPAPGAPAQAGAPAALAATSPLDSGKELIARGDFAGAIAPLKEAIGASPDSAEAHRLLGLALLKAENIAEAEPEIKRAIDLDPTILGANFDLGMVYIKKGRLMQAIPFMEKEREGSPDSEAVLKTLGQLYSDTKQHDKAVEIFTKLLDQSPDNIEYYSFLADAYKQKGDTAKELETYQRMGAQDPSGMAFYNLGNIMFNKSEIGKAADAYKKAIEMAPDNAAAHYQLGLTYVNQAKFKDAVVELETFIKLKPKDSKAGETKTLITDLKKMGG